MQASQIPSKVPLPFANSGTKNAIPTASQIGVTAGAASLTDGFPPLTFTPIASGGVPPSGADFNGVLNLITAVQQWQCAGGSFKFDAAFAASVGGYPKGAVLIKATNDGFWISTTDSNSANPDTGGAGWSDPIALSFTGSNQNKANPGYQKLPGGFILQMGIATTNNANGSVTVTLPTSFTGPGTYVVMVTNSAGSAPQGFGGVNQTSGAGFVLWAASSAGVSIGSGVPFLWFAIGF
jgi:hypothetical protein